MQTTTQTTTLTYDQAQNILAQAKAAKACANQYKAAAQALKRNDLEGFERICRASHTWLAENGIDYTMTDGLGDEFYFDGILKYRYTYKDGKREGLAQGFYLDGKLSSRYTYKDGKRQGLGEGFYPGGTCMFRCTYKDDKLHGLEEGFHLDGTVCSQTTYKNGVKQ
jgi:antitoxin component YwqK of YwqJK toxin-antitoxin module